MSDAAIAPPALEESLVVPQADWGAVRAQRFVRSVLTGSGVDREVADVAVLLAKALISNGILHARSGVAVTVTVSPESIQIEVADETSELVHVVGRSWGVATISR